MWSRHHALVSITSILMGFPYPVLVADKEEPVANN
jgi:hypothetical protein